MRAVVTGAAGFIGRHLTARLEAEGHAVFTIDPASPGSRETLPNGVLDAGLALEVARFAPDVVFHLAAQADVGRSWERPALDAQLNLAGTANVIEAVRACARPPRLVFTSSYLMYGTARGPVYGEPNHCVPESPYALAKWAAVRLIEMAAEREGFEFSVAVLANVYGPGGDNVVTTLARAAVEGRSPWLLEDETRDFVYVDDVVDALLAAAAADGSAICNVGSGKETAMPALWRKLRRIAGSKQEAEIRPGGTRAVLAVGHAEGAWGWRPATKLDDGLAAVVDHERARAGAMEAAA